MATNEDVSAIPLGAHVVSDSVVESSSSGQATIVGSYRDDYSYTNFPRYHHVPDSFGVPQIYCRSLLTSGNGFPPSNITGDVYRPDFHYSMGACIGDVGYVDEYGSFVFCFNILCSRDDDIQAIELPADFVQFTPPLTSESIDFTEVHHPPGTIITSEGIDVSRIAESPLRVKFSSSKREGAALILPKGASREDLVDPSQFYSYIKANAAKWYQLCNKADNEKIPGPGHMVPNGALFLVTGVDRASSWATATFPYRRKGSRAFNFEFDEGSIPTWKGAAGMNTIYRHYQDASVEGSVGAVFIRFMSIAIKPMRKGGRLGDVPRIVLPTSQEPLPPSMLSKVKIPKMFDRFNQETKITPVPPGELIFNPSFILLQVLQKVKPTAEVYTILDSVWRADLNKEQLFHSELIKWMHRILKHNHIIEADGVAMFTSRPQEKMATPPLPFWRHLIPCLSSVDGETVEDPEERIALKRLHAII